MDNPTRASQAAAGGNQGGGPPTEGQPFQGALAGRRVSDQERQAQTVGLGERQRPTGSAGPSLEGRDIRLGRVSAVSSGSGPPAPGAVTQQQPSVGQAPFRETLLEGPRRDPPPVVQHSSHRPVGWVRWLRDAELPWLAADQNARRRAIQTRVEEIRNQGVLPARLMSELLVTVDFVSQIERFVLEAHSLRQRSRIELLDEKEWDALCSMGYRLRADIPRQQAEMREVLERSAEGGVLPPEVEALWQEMQQRLATAHRYLCSAEAG